MNRLITSAALMISLSAPTVFAAEFDGRYDVVYEQAKGQTDLCVQIEETWACIAVDLEAAIEDGAITEDALHQLADDAITTFEDASGRELSEGACAQVHNGVAHTYQQAEAYLGQVVAEMPSEIIIDQVERSPDALVAILTNENGEGRTVAGSINPNTGAFNLQGSLAGQINRDNDYDGEILSSRHVDVEWAHEVLPVSVSLMGDISLDGQLISLD